MHRSPQGLFNQAQTEEIKTPTGILKASWPETTAWDLIRYLRAVGGLDHVVTVLSELAERLDPKRLHETVKRHGEILVAQRLGYLLDHLGRRDLTKDIASSVDDAPVRLLDPASRVSGTSESRKGRLLVNTRVEPEA